MLFTFKQKFLWGVRVTEGVLKLHSGSGIRFCSKYCFIHFIGYI